VLRVRNYELDFTFLMRAITVVECGIPQIKKLAEKIEKNRPSKTHLNQTWRRAQSAVDRTIKTLQRDLHLDKSKFITSKNALVPLVYYFAQHPKGSDRNVLRFFILSHLSGHYGAGAENALRRDFRILADPSLTPKQGLAELVDSLDKETRQYYRGLKMRPDQVRGLPSKNVLILLMYILMRERKASDWGSGRQKPLGDIEPLDLQLHHIFPFNLMINNAPVRKSYIDNGYSPAEFRAEVNDITNLTFVSQAKNSAIGDAPPWQYLPIETTKEMRKAHFIPEEPELWKPENYGDFLEARRMLLSKAMTRFLKRL